ncbi:FkbM family methyltransferase [Nocardiopsis eucommiae]|uniref:FkbM family methyltransferase n=1 Tax=Nocardiopsis eucommiae TaxID=2831970 RepID=A0A975LBY8_9ACTN|nr:FkbM family methyltransferase [Nocardiopsis eucommiae]
MKSFTRATLRTAIQRAPAFVPKRAIRWLDNDLLHNPVTTAAPAWFGGRFPVTTSDIIQRYLYTFGTWEPHLSAWITRRLTTGDTFVDVGANIGYYTMLASHLVGPTGHVAAVEPVPCFHHHLQATLLLNGARNVRTIEKAVAIESGRVEMFLADPGNLGGTSTIRPRVVREAFHADAAPLPDLLTPVEIRDARLIKIDVEGAEVAAAQSLAPVLGTLRPDAELIIEVTPRALAKQGADVDDVIAPLRAAGFHTYRITNDYDPTTYPAAIRTPALPQRWEQPVTGMSDLVFSRIDADHL